MRVKDSEPECETFKSIQLIQNNLMRMLNGTKIKDMVSISSLLNKFIMLSINQLNAKVKLVEMWKAMNLEDYPLKVEQQSCDVDRVSTRADTTGRPVEMGRSNLTQKTCISDAIRLWNQAPEKIINSRNIAQVKLEIKKYVKSILI